MGCEESNLSKISEIRISVIDPSFMKTGNKSIWEALDANHITYENYISVACFLDEFSKKYTNYIIAKEEAYDHLVTGLKDANYSPHVLIISANPSQKSQELKIKYPQTHFVASYEAAISNLTHKRESLNQEISLAKKRTKIDLKILRNMSNQTFSESMIFEETLKVKQIKFEKYDSFQQLQDSLQATDSDFIVTDYSYHREVVNLVKKSNTKVICFCSLDEKEGYDPDVYFITNNFQEIANEVNQQKNMKNLIPVPCTKAFIYSNGDSQFYKYGRILSKYSLHLKKCNNLSELLADTKYYFCVSLICAEDQKKNVEKYLQTKGSAFRIKLITIPSETQNSEKGLRKVLKQLKKGYRAQKGVTKSIDIIDKHNESSKFDEIKAELERNNIGYFCYNDLNSYIKNLRFVSPYVICNFEERSLLYRYLEQIKSKSKIIVFCNKNKITGGIVDGKRLVFISSHFGKILKHLKTNLVFNPVILNENNIKINEKQMQLKNKKQRISALKWGGSEGPAEGKRQDNLSFINVDSDANQKTLKSIQSDNSAIWSFQSKTPVENLETFKKDLTESLVFLKKLYKINYPEAQFLGLLQKVKSMNLFELVTKIREFFQSENQFGIRINNSLRAIQKIDNEEIVHLREFIYLSNLNFLTPFFIPKLGKVKLSHWTKEYPLEKCAVGSKLISKNFFIMYENLDDIENQTTSFHRIDVELEYNTLTESEFLINSFFRHKGKYIFAPYSQFVVKNIRKQVDVTVIALSYEKNVEFLKTYYENNFLTNGENILSLFEKDIQKQESMLVSTDGKPKVERNLIRLRALKNYKDGNLQKAVQEQQKAIKMEEQIDDFDSSKINQLNYELAAYYCKIQKAEEALKLIKELMQASPGSFIINECCKLTEKLHQTVKKQPEGDRKRKMTEHIIRCEQLKEENESQSENSEGFIDGQININDEIQCIEVDDTFGKNPNFKDLQKENFD